MFSRNTESLALNDCNVIESDLEYLPPHLKHLDVSNNDTLANLPSGIGGLLSLNLLHTRVPSQAQIALQALRFPAEFLAINVTREDLPHLKLLVSKQIRHVELCISPSIADIHSVFEDECAEWSSINCHRWSSFPSTWNISSLRETLPHAMVHMCKCSNFISKAHWNRCA
jgi:Leucine-rich repeat (LRR) protein